MIPAKNRLGYIDIFKGIGILLMIMGHTWFGPNFDHFIHGFHMPMFFFISGFLFTSSSTEKMKVSAYIIKKAYRLLLPYCIWGVGSYFVWIVRWGNRSWDPFVHLLFENTTGLPIAGAMWFLTAFFIAEIIYFLLVRYVKNMKFRTFLVCVIAFSGNVATKLLPFRLPYAMDAAFVGVGLIHIGYCIKTYLYKGEMLNIKKGNIAVIIAIGIFTTILIFKNGEVNMRKGLYANIALFWFNSISASLVGLNISYMISMCRNGMVQRLIKPLKRIGRNSMLYLCLNELILSEVGNVLYMLDHKIEFIHIDGMVFSIFAFMTTMLILYVADIVICGTKLRICVGQ